MKVIFVRHGEAAHGYPDNVRQLTTQGKEQAERTAQYILNSYTPDLFVVSPYTRAQETLKFFSSKCPNVPIKVLDSITPDNNPVEGLKDLSNFESDEVQCLLVICHMPIVANMVGLILGQYSVPYALAEARVLECEAIADNLGTQVDSFIPN